MASSMPLLEHMTGSLMQFCQRHILGGATPEASGASMGMVLGQAGGVLVWIGQACIWLGQAAVAGLLCQILLCCGLSWYRERFVNMFMLVCRVVSHGPQGRALWSMRATHSR